MCVCVCVRVCALENKCNLLLVFVPSSNHDGGIRINPVGALMKRDREAGCKYRKVHEQRQQHTNVLLALSLAFLYRDDAGSSL